jgi:hypothetical protein
VLDEPTRRVEHEPACAADRDAAVRESFVTTFVPVVNSSPVTRSRWKIRTPLFGSEAPVSGLVTVPSNVASQSSRTGFPSLS